MAGYGFAVLGSGRNGHLGGFPRGIATLGENQFFIDAWLLINLHQEFAFGWNKSVFGILNFEGVFPSWLVGFEGDFARSDAAQRFSRGAGDRSGGVFRSGEQAV